MAGSEANKVAVVGGGPAGLAAALAARQAGAPVVLIDEHEALGGQLRKQIHKFFGSKDHRAGVRGYKIAEELEDACHNSKVEILCQTAVLSLRGRNISLAGQGAVREMTAGAVILAAGAAENALCFEGCTLPGVMGAGAAQTFVNLHRVLPGQKILVVGAGNVGLIVAYQLLQAGAEVLGLIDSSARIGGYGVHAAKIRRAGVPVWLKHTVLKAEGEGQVEQVQVVTVDDYGAPIDGSERILKADTICLAAGLTPLAELAWQAGCQLGYQPHLGGHVPLHSPVMETSLARVFVAGDVAGVEEASTALEEGTIAGLAAAASLGYSRPPRAAEAAQERLKMLRSGPFGDARQRAKDELIRRWAACRQR